MAATNRWWAIDDADLIAALDEVAHGRSVVDVYRDLCANSEIEEVPGE